MDTSNQNQNQNNNDNISKETSVETNNDNLLNNNDKNTLNFDKESSEQLQSRLGIPNDENEKQSMLKNAISNNDIKTMKNFMWLSLKQNEESKTKTDSHEKEKQTLINEKDELKKQIDNINKMYSNTVVGNAQQQMKNLINNSPGLFGNNGESIDKFFETLRKVNNRELDNGVSQLVACSSELYNQTHGNMAKRNFSDYNKNNSVYETLNESFSNGGSINNVRISQQPNKKQMINNNRNDDILKFLENDYHSDKSSKILNNFESMHNEGWSEKINNCSEIDQ